MQKAYLPIFTKLYYSKNIFKSKVRYALRSFLDQKTGAGTKSAGK
jgi:hypothetical protein